MMEKRKLSSSEESQYDRKLSSSESKRLKSSDFRTEELTDIGLFFADNPITVLELKKKLKLALEIFPLNDRRSRRNLRRNTVEIPTCIESLCKFTKEHVNFNLENVDWNKKVSLAPKFRNELLEFEKEAIIDLQEAKILLMEFSEEFLNGETNESGLMTDKLGKRMFLDWSTNTSRFLSEIQKVLQKLGLPLEVPPEPIRDKIEDVILRESVFTSLFMKFTEIFFLQPDFGENRKISIKIRNKYVGCIPDVRFNQRVQKSEGRSCLLLMLAEVKKDALKLADDDDDSKTPWIEKHLKKQVLGQIGSQLLLECWHSVFVPKSLGIVCMGTEIIFLYMDTDFNHYEALMANNITDSHRSTIHYTKSFDIMKMEDRNELVDFLFWLGCLQIQDFNEYFCC
ncbi:uncharacterized protein LOC127724194 [Mytilus californianus]|uniref:uncharacterized protein LOC127724194 n=1 Tax=Mytilus californianus TaxID=6549 RepID=UPI002246854D|nr:uncharacterized protein LOC127724194 [Mytilus californianus]